MIKLLLDYDGWNEEKKVLNAFTKSQKTHPRMRQIWFVKLGLNIGHEIDGKGEFSRPVLVISKIGSLFWCIPLTTKHKDDFFHFLIRSVEFPGKTSSLLLSQGRILDQKRFLEYRGTVSKSEFKKIQKKLRRMYFPASS